eukprot:gb/GFBE01032157.1/.p1 GENE.gb/GFBE01032157.1/~~gb/GFBE01032157.1/.p1  ORF type:complete len:263 (+),score=58.45 gb/GFBE01032157.1/:1-789(+)
MGSKGFWSEMLSLAPYSEWQAAVDAWGAELVNGALLCVATLLVGCGLAFGKFCWQAKAADGALAAAGCGTPKSASHVISRTSLGDVEVSRCTVFDFDEVLSVQQVLGAAQLSEHGLRRVFGGAERLAALDVLLQDLLEHDVALAVVSRNSSEIVRRALAGAKVHIDGVPEPLLRHFSPDLIFGCEDYGDDVPKSEVIANRIMRPNSLSPADVLFVDDCLLNVCEVRQRCKVEALHVRNGGGMDAWDMEYVKVWARAPGTFGR